MLCSSCKTEIPDDSAFCNRCGARAGPGGAPPKGSEASIPAPAHAAPPAPPDSFFQAPGPGGRLPEAELWRGGVSPKAYALEFLGLAFLFLLLLAGFILVGNRWFSYAILASAALWILYLGFRILKARLTLRYRLTTERLFRERGFFRRTADELELIRVDDVEVRQNFVQRMFDVGTVVVVSTDRTEAELLLEGIEHPTVLKEMIREHTRRLRGKALHVEQI